MFATTSEYLRLYTANQDEDEQFQISKIADLPNNSDYSGPLTSMDWSPFDLNQIATASLDSTVSIWDITRQSVLTQLVAHEQSAVHDIQFTENSRFCTVGREGSVRLFDLRQLESSSIIFETPNKEPLIKIAGNISNKNHIAVVMSNSKDVILLDQRKP